MPVINKNFIVNRLSIFSRPHFYEFDAEFSFADGNFAVVARKIEKYSSKITAPLEYRVTVFREGEELGSTRTFKIIDTVHPFRIVESVLRDRLLFRQYLISICNLVVCLDKVGMKGLDPVLATTLRYSASVAAVTFFCLEEEGEAVVTSCQDMVVDPLLRRGLAPLLSAKFRYAGQR